MCLPRSLLALFIQALWAAFPVPATQAPPSVPCPGDPSLRLLPPPRPTGLSRGQSCPSHISASPPLRSLLTEAHPTCVLLWKQHLPSPTPQGLELQDLVSPSCCISWVPALCESEGSAPVGVQGEGEGWSLSGSSDQPSENGGKEALCGAERPGRAWPQVVVVCPDLSLGLWGVCLS